MSDIPSVQEMIYDLWKCLEIDPSTGEKYLRVVQERDPVPPGPEPEPEEQSEDAE